MIKTLIFDFGDVFLNLDKPATLEELKKLGLGDFSNEMVATNKAYEVGKLSTEEFLKFYQKHFPKQKDSALVQAWNAILLDFPQHRLEFLQQLKKEGKYQLILLSNTNDLHIKWVKENIKNFTEFKNCFDAFYLSHEINFRKPDPAIYKFVAKRHDLNPEETLFVDDTEDNTEAAKKLGFRTWNIDPAKQDVVDLFSHKADLF